MSAAAPLSLFSPAAILTIAGTEMDAHGNSLLVVSNLCCHATYSGIDLLRLGNREPLILQKTCSWWK